jgi:Four helix bundle sensory module for signal transduction
MRPARTSARALVVSFAAVAATFTLATAVAQLANLKIHSAAQDITANTSPTISYLSSMRGTMRQLEVGVDEVMDSCRVGHCREAPREIDAHRHALVTDWETYQKFPTSPGERDTWPIIASELRVLDGALTRVFGELARAAPGAAEELFRVEVKPSFDRLDKAVASRSHRRSMLSRADRSPSRWPSM